MSFDFDELEQNEEGVKRWVLVRPRCGLANRLRAIVSGLKLARDTGFLLAIDWRMEADCNCPWRRLFEALPPGAWLLTPALLAKHAALRAAAATLDELDVRLRRWEYVGSAECSEDVVAPHRDSGAARVVHHDLWREPDARWLALAGTPLEAASAELAVGCGWLGQRCLAFGTTAPFYPPHPANIFVPNVKYEREHSDLLRQLRPAAHILERAIAMPESAVALHVRRGDHDASREVSTLEAFILAIGEEVEKARDGQARFFLATDCADTEAQLLRRFGQESVQVYRKRSRQRDRPEAIEDAFVDLLSLGSCSKILGSHRSSFTDLAALLRLVPKVIVKAPAAHDPWAAGPPDKCERNAEDLRGWRDRLRRQRAEA